MKAYRLRFPDIKPRDLVCIFLEDIAVFVIKYRLMKAGGRNNLNTAFTEAFSSSSAIRPPRTGCASTIAPPPARDSRLIQQEIFVVVHIQHRGHLVRLIHLEENMLMALAMPQRLWGNIPVTVLTKSLIYTHSFIRMLLHSLSPLPLSHYQTLPGYP